MSSFNNFIKVALFCIVGLLAAILAYLILILNEIDLVTRLLRGVAAF